MKAILIGLSLSLAAATPDPVRFNLVLPAPVRSSIFWEFTKADVGQLFIIQKEYDHWLCVYAENNGRWLAVPGEAGKFISVYDDNGNEISGLASTRAFYARVEAPVRIKYFLAKYPTERCRPD